MKKYITFFLISLISFSYAYPYGKYFKANTNYDNNSNKELKKVIQHKYSKYIPKEYTNIIDVKFYNMPIKQIFLSLSYLNDKFKFIWNDGGEKEKGGGQGKKSKGIDYKIPNIKLTFVYKGPFINAIKSLCEEANLWCEKEGSLWKISRYKIFKFKLPVHFTQTGEGYSISYKNLIKELKKVIKEGDVYIDEIGNLVLITTYKEYEKARKIIEAIKNQKEMLLDVYLVRFTHKKNLETSMNLNTIIKGINTNIAYEGGELSTSSAKVAYTSGGVSAILKALQSFGKVKIVKNWQVKTLTNNIIKLNIVDKVPMIVAQEAENSNGESNNNVGYNVEFKDVGLKIVMLPYLLDRNGEKIAIDSTITLSEVENMIELPNVRVPQISENELYIPIVLKNGEKAVISLFKSTNREKSMSGLPKLIKIPILRYLFGSSVNKDEETELLLVLTPKVLN